MHHCTACYRLPCRYLDRYSYQAVPVHSLTIQTMYGYCRGKSVVCSLVSAPKGRYSQIYGLERLWFNRVRPYGHGQLSIWRPMVKADVPIALPGGGPQLRATGCHLPYGITQCYLPPDTTQLNAPRLTLAMQAGTRYTYPGGMEGWVDLVDLIAPRPGVELATFRSRVRRRTAAPPRQLCALYYWVI